MEEMVKDILMDAKGRKFTIAFTKKNGERRIMNGSLHKDHFKGKFAIINTKDGVRMANTTNVHWIKSNKTTIAFAKRKEQL